MSVSRTFEQSLLASAETALSAAVVTLGDDPNGTVRLEVLEAVACRVGGWDLVAYRELTSTHYVTSPTDALAAAAPVLKALAAANITIPLALSSLAQPSMSAHARRTEGAYYTDFRLASYVAQGLCKDLTPESLLIDSASGTGILLVAAVLQTCGEDQVARAEMIGQSVSASDLSSASLRGARLALASLTHDLRAIRGLCSRMRIQDALLEGADQWTDVAPDGFAAVIGNPPWEKVKVTRHEFLQASGERRHYGADYVSAVLPHAAITAERVRVADYADELATRYPLSTSGEPDLYKAFFELALRLASPRGRVGLLLPAGLIRSQGTEQLRRHLFDTATDIDLTVFENRARFFAIDTRFKFLVVNAGLGGRREPSMTLRHAHGTPTGVDGYGEAKIARSQLAHVRPDLTVPEVRSSDEWRLFKRMNADGVRLGDPRGPWRPRIVREVDMTRDRTKFHPAADADRIPLVEGRMVHQFRCGAKSYVSGTGRRARWDVNAFGRSEIAPQFWISVNDMPKPAARRFDLARVGFCDVTGQTNERTILATTIPRGVICGNKVPTVTFDGPAGRTADAHPFWVAVVNSFAFDWLARRVVTTTVNFFLLLGLPFPRTDPDSLPGRRIALLAKEVESLDHGGSIDPWLVADKRALIDARVAAAYGLALPDVELIFTDFPLLDRGQPALRGEPTSTVTRDLVLSCMAELLNEPADGYRRRVSAAAALGAKPYIPGQYADGDETAAPEFEEVRG